MISPNIVFPRKKKKLNEEIKISSSIANSENFLHRLLFSFSDPSLQVSQYSPLVLQVKTAFFINHRLSPPGRETAHCIADVAYRGGARILHFPRYWSDASKWARFPWGCHWYYLKLLPFPHPFLGYSLVYWKEVGPQRQRGLDLNDS